MPTYEYVCKSCGNRFDVWQSFSDDALTTCEACGGSLRKVFGNVGITFKGSGFYKTDSRSGSSSAGSSSGEGGSSSGESKPADTTSGDSGTSSSSSGHSHGHTHGAHSHTH